MNEQQAFEEALRIQAVGAGTPTLTLDDVRGRARGIRRRRASVAAAAGAAVVAAAVVPIALLVGGGTSDDTLPPVDAPTVSDTANPVPSGPSAAWIVDGEVRTADGTAFELPVDGEVSYLLRMAGDQWVLGAYPEGAGREFQVLVVDSSGSVLSTHPATDGGLVRDDAGSAVGWIDEDRRPRILVPGSDEPFVLPVVLEGRAAPSPREILPGCTTTSCRMLVEVYDGSPDGSSDLVVSLDGTTEPLERLGLLSITDVSPDGALVSGLVSADEMTFEYCSAVLELATGTELWSTCDAGSFRFSPDSRSVLGADAYLDGFGHSFAEVRDARDGEVVRGFEAGTVFDERWNDDESFLVSMQTNAGENLLLRVPVDGGEPEVVESVPGTPGDPEGIIRLGG